MSIKNSDLARNAMLDSLSTLLGASMKLSIYSGTEPTDEGTALSGNTLLIEYTMGPSAAAGGSKQWVPSTLTGPGVGAGNATFYRIWNSAKSAAHEQGSVTATGGGGDLTLDNVSIAVGQTVNVTGMNKTQPG